jgi:hypothetical protein
MPRLKAMPRRKTHEISTNPAVEQTLSQIGDPRMAASLAILYAELARAQSDRDAEAVQFANRGIRELLRGVPDGPIDMPLLPLLNKRKKKPRK